MALGLSGILPNISQTIDGIGFIFGAGTSREAGYPMMPDLTRAVVNGLSRAERTILDEVLTASKAVYDDSKATPNIEQLSDLIIAHWTNSNDPRYNVLEGKMRELILDQILAVSNPNIDNHLKFFEALKKRTFGLPSTVWIFTTNYDLLFETAAARANVILENGFSGTTERFFNPGQYRSISGTISNGNFAPNSQLTVKLVKLHGSISWFDDGSKFYERHPVASPRSIRRIMIMPRRRKVIDTLTPPYDTLFTESSKAIGGNCKYLVSCGFSFGDEHINQQLILPALQANKCRLFALMQDDLPSLDEFKLLPSFSAGFSSHLYIDSKKTVDTTSLWKFSEFAKLF